METYNCSFLVLQLLLGLYTEVKLNEVRIFRPPLPLFHSKKKMAGLSQDEIDSCRDAFLAFDKDRSGTIDVWELRQVLEGTVEIVIV
jgi:hypothetical protein